MKNIEQHIKENIEQYNSGEMPQGHRERFMAKLQQEVASSNTPNYNTKKLSGLLTKILLPIAAVFALALIIHNISLNKTSETTIEEISYAQNMQEEEQEVIDMAKQFSKEKQQKIMAILNNITFEAIPLAEQLPEELSQEQKAKILKEYYKQKTDGIKSIKTYIAQEITNTDK